MINETFLTKSDLDNGHCSDIKIRIALKLSLHYVFCPCNSITIHTSQAKCPESPNGFSIR